MEKGQLAEVKTEALENLRSYLAQVPAGELDFTTNKETERLLAKCWDELNFESRGANLTAYKLVNRTEQLTWEPPLLTFKIERHGATTNGSVYAHVYSWTVNVARGTATMDEWPKRRLVGTRAPRLKIEPSVDEILNLVLNCTNDQRLKWSDNRLEVKLLLNKIVPANNWQTQQSRNVRFWKAFVIKVREHGWEAADDIRIRLEGRYPHVPARLRLMFKAASGTKAETSRV
jgi:hypothetical protein